MSPFLYTEYVIELVVPSSRL